jgi:hypothetical protein
MQDPIYVAKRLAKRVAVSDVAAEIFDLWRKIGRGAIERSMHLRRAAVENPDLVPCRQQLVGDMRADESGAACNQNA